MLLTGYEKIGSSGKFESPWSLHIGYFWNIHSMTSPKRHELGGEVDLGSFAC